MEKSRVTVAAGGSQELRFSRSFGEPGAHRLRFSVNAKGDQLPADDVAWLGLFVEALKPLLVVDGNRVPEPLHNESDLFRLALGAPAGGGNAALPYRVEVISPAELLRKENLLQQYSGILYLNVREPDEAAVNRLGNYAGAGGSLMVVLGERCRTEEGNKVLHRDGRGLIPCELLSWEGDTESTDRYETPVIGEGDPCLGYFGRPGAMEADLAQVRIKAWHKVKVHPRLSGTRTVLRLSNGDPLLLSRDFGKGRLYVLTTGLNLKCSDLHLHPAFLALARGLADALAAHPLPQFSLTAGEKLSARFRGSSRGADISLAGPAGGKLPLEVRRRENADLVEYSNLRQTGFFTLRAEKDGTVKEYPFAVGLDTRESDLAPLPRAKVNQAVARLGAHTASSWEELAPFFKRARQHQHLWWWLIGLAVVLALLELYLSRRTVRSFVDASKLAGTAVGSATTPGGGESR